MLEDGSETKLFGEHVRNQTNYGSTTKPIQKFVKYVKHTVSRVDTLQGIALKYGATVEQINRENKLWTNDSLFLREYLYIPVTADNSHLVQDDWALVTSDEVRSRSGSSDLTRSDVRHKSLSSSSDPYVGHFESFGANGSQSDDARGATRSKNDAHVDSRATRSIGIDFFSKYDSSIADLKTKVKQLEKSAHQPDTNLSSLIPHRHSDTYAHITRMTPHFIANEEPESLVMIIWSNTRSSKVQSALTFSEQAIDG